MSSRRRLRVAVIGLGYFSQFHLRAWARIDDVELVGVADQDDSVCEAVASRYEVPGFDTLEAMLAAVQPDIVDIVTPPPSHYGYITEALAPGRTIICQKPFCMSLEEAAAVSEAAKETGAKLVVHENFRFQPWHREIKRQLDAGLLGRIYQCRFSLRPGDGRGPNAYLDRQPSFQSMERFLVRETAVHQLDLFTWLLGKIDRVYADLRQLNPAIAGEDTGTMLFTHAGGARSQFDGNRLSDHVAGNRRKTMGEMEIEGEGGRLRLDGEGRLYFRGFGSNHENEIEFSYEDRDFGGGCVEALHRHVVAHLLEGEPLENQVGDYLDIVALEEATYRSAREGYAIAID